MRQRLLSVLVSGLAVAVVALARPSVVAADGAVGYAYLTSLETGGGSAPLGAFLSLHGRGQTSLEIDFGYHRDTEASVTLNTFTGMAGLHVSINPHSGTSTVPFLHVLGGARYDRISGSSNTSFGGMAGGGIDIRPGGIGLRLGADFQIFFDEGANQKALRLGVGLTF